MTTRPTPIDWNAVARDLIRGMAKALQESPASCRLLIGMGILERVTPDEDERGRA